MLLVLIAASAAACGAFSSTDARAPDAGMSDDVDATSSSDGGASPIDGSWGTSDAAPKSDASAPCVPHSPISFMGGGFDNGLTFTILGNSYPVPVGSGGTSVGLIAGGSKGTADALHIHTTANRYVLEAPPVDVAGGVCKITSTFDINWESVMKGTNDVTFAVVGVRNNAFDHCYVYFQYLHATGQFELQSHCGIRDGGDFNQYKPSAPAFPTGFVRIVLTLDLPKAEASVSVGGALTTLPLGTNQVIVGGPTAYAEVGFDGTGYDAVVDLDSIDVNVQ